MRRARFIACSYVTVFWLYLSAGDMRAQQLPAAAQQRFSAAQELLLRGDVDGALAAAREGLKVAPRSVEGLNLLGIIFNQQQQYSNAEEVFDEALKIDPRSTKTHNNLGKSYLLSSQPDLAEREFRATLRLNPLDPAANYNLGSVLLAKGDAHAAITYLERVQPGDEGTSLTLVTAYLSANQTVKAKILCNTLSAQYRADPRLHFSLGVTFASKKQYAAAIHELELADALMPGTFEILHNLGEAYLRNNKNTKAEETLNRALALRPNSVDTIYLLAQAEADEHKYLEALDLLQRARKLDPANADVLFLMGRISMVQNLYEDAIAVLQEGVQIAPRQPDLHAALGESYLGVERVDRALEEFKTLIELDPSATSYAFMGIAYRQLGRFDEAKKSLLQGLAKDPHNAACLYNLGFIADKQGDDPQALRFLSAALTAEPDLPDALYLFATVKMRRGDYAEAIPLLRRCVRSAPYAARAYYKLATAERKLQQKAAASRDLTMFETLSRHREGDPVPVQDFESVSHRATLRPEQMREADIAELQDQVTHHPDTPRPLYFLAEAYLKVDDFERARKTIARLDQLSGADYRTALGVGTLLAKYKSYPEAIQHFQLALTANPMSDDAKYDLAYAYLQTGDNAKALELVEGISPDAQENDNYIALRGVILAHLGRTFEAVHALESAVQRNPDNDHYVLLLALTQLRADAPESAYKTIREGLVHVPDSGFLFWGLGVLSAIKGRNEDAERDFAHASDLLPDWPAAYALFGTFYCETGQISKARHMLDRYHQLFGSERPEMKGLEQKLDGSNFSAAGPIQLSGKSKLDFLQTALSMADLL